MPTEKKPKNIQELEPGSTEWLNAFAALSPQDQAAIFNFNEAVPNVDTEFNDLEGGGGLAGTAATLPPGLGGAELDPLYQQLLQFGGGVGIPQLTAKGALEPYDLQQEQARHNLMQDQATAIADVILSSLAGPGALDPASFAPIVTMPTEKIKTPGMTQLRRYAAGTGYKAYIAQKMLPVAEGGQGATDDEALADLYNDLAMPESGDVSPEAKATRQALIDSLPSAFGSANRIQLPSGSSMFDTGLAERPSQDVREAFDEPMVAKWANDMYFKVADEQAEIDAGWQDPNAPGTYYTDAPTEELSPLAQKFKNLGLPSPFAAYNDPEYLQMANDIVAPNLGASMGLREQNIADTQAEQLRLGQETRGPIDRNIALQREYAKMTAPKPPPPPFQLPAAGMSTPAGTRGGGPAPLQPQMPQPMGGLGLGGAAGAIGGAVGGSGAAGALRAQGIPGAPAGPGAPVTPAPFGGVGGMLGGAAGALAGGNPARGAAGALGGGGGGGLFGGIADAVRNAIMPSVPQRGGGAGTAVPPPFALPPQAGPWVVGNAETGYETAPNAQAAQGRALGNRALNFNFGFGGGARPTETEPLSKTVAAYSQKGADDARKRYADANTRRYQAEQYTPQDLGAAVRALASANVAARSGRTPYVDTVLQRLLGQRAVGVRGI